MPGVTATNKRKGKGAIRNAHHTPGGDSINLGAGHTVLASTVIAGNTQVVLSDGSLILLVGITDITGIFH
jgi:hypothetical protein